MIKHIALEHFKNVSNFDTDLDAINVLVGANNSGKSSVLQGIHFTILAEVVRRIAQRETVSQQQLLYVPSSDFTVLRHGAPYSNYSGNTSKLILTSDTCSDGENNDAFSITISKGRNFGNISIETVNNNPFRQRVTASAELYSVYVPGISGIALEEKLQSKSVIRHAAANGDANLYLRNIIYYINKNHELEKLNGWIRKIFPATSISIPYDPDQDININVTVATNEVVLPIELSGTGFLQIIQIMAYTLLFKPQLLLLDEPDEHLHPDNQTLLADTLKFLSENLGVQIILSTHSRHMLAAFDDDARFIWMKDGTVFQSDASSDIYEVLLDIGALDSYDKVVRGIYSCIVLTEDQKIKMMKRLLKYNGFNMERTLVVPYKGCANLEAALQLSDFIHQSAPDCLVVIHRDRDFMTNEEVSEVEQKIHGPKTVPFVTDGSDIEAYFVNPQHIASLVEESTASVEAWLSELATQNHVEIQSKFQNKRRDIEYSFLYRNNRDQCPSFLDLFRRDIPTIPENRLGKYMLKKANGDINNKFNKSVDLLSQSDFLRVEKLHEILEMLS